jgi:CBS-domain-containing membrane protein
MTRGVSCCFEDQDISEAAELMESKQIRRLLVLNHDNRLVGIVSLGDLAVRGHNHELSAEALELISEGTSSKRGAATASAKIPSGTKGATKRR